MKKAMKKLMAALLAVAMVCAMAIPAFAASGSSPADKGSITIDNAVVGKDYTIYKMFDLDSFDTDANDGAGNYSYTVVPDWEDFFKDSAAGNSYITLENGHPTWVGAENADAYKQFAKDALAYATSKEITATDKKTANDTTVEFNSLDLGYYLVDTSLGVLCGLDTTKPNATIKEKNGQPTIDKYVFENGALHAGYSNDASIGDTVKFQINVAVLDGQPRNYVIHDAMSAGLTFNEASVVVTRHRVTDAPIPGSSISQVTLTKDTDYIVETTTACTASTKITGCTFEIKFKDTALKANDIITVQYTATVNANAVIGVEGNPNETILEYNNKYTAKPTTKTYVWEMGVHKFANLGTGKENTPLENAEFRLYKMDGTTTMYAKFAETSTNTSIYKLTGWTGNAEEAATKVKTPVSGNIKFEGLDAGTYYLEETKAPTGYNTLTAPINVVIESTLPAASGTASYTVKYGETTASDGVVRVENKTGTVLPSTGGIGTTIFYVIGGGLMVAAAILLITKKRMENR